MELPRKRPAFLPIALFAAVVTFLAYQPEPPIAWLTAARTGIDGQSIPHSRSTVARGGIDVQRISRSRRSDGTDGARVETSKDRAPIYSFEGDASSRAAALSSFERIDDVIMGGMSKSQIVDGGSLASWRGLVRTDGGGFCGQRTKAFREPLNLTGADGLYIACRLASDADADRRVWKLTLRTDEGRGEVVYQAPYSAPVGSMPEPVYVPFSDFVLVRGPVAVPGAPKISNVSAVYQLGFTVSKFIIGTQMTQLDGFRNGSFQLDIAAIGVYSERRSGAVEQIGSTVAPDLLPDNEAKRKQPLLIRVLLLPLLGLVFSEAKRRRARAAQLLRERGASRWKLAKMGWLFKTNLRSQSFGVSTLQTLGEAVSAILGFVIGLVAKLTIFPVFRLLARRRMRKQLGAEAEKVTRLER